MLGGREIAAMPSQTLPTYLPPSLTASCERCEQKGDNIARTCCYLSLVQFGIRAAIDTDTFATDTATFGIHADADTFARCRYSHTHTQFATSLSWITFMIYLYAMMMMMPKELKHIVNFISLFISMARSANPSPLLSTTFLTQFYNFTACQFRIISSVSWPNFGGFSLVHNLAYAQ